MVELVEMELLTVSGRDRSSDPGSPKQEVKVSRSPKGLGAVTNVADSVDATIGSFGSALSTEESIPDLASPVIRPGIRESIPNPVVSSPTKSRSWRWRMKEGASPPHSSIRNGYSEKKNARGDHLPAKVAPEPLEPLMQSFSKSLAPALPSSCNSGFVKSPAVEISRATQLQGSGAAPCTTVALGSSSPTKGTQRIQVLTPKSQPPFQRTQVLSPNSQPPSQCTQVLSPNSQPPSKRLQVFSPKSQPPSQRMQILSPTSHPPSPKSQPQICAQRSTARDKGRNYVWAVKQEAASNVKSGSSSRSSSPVSPATPASPERPVRRLLHSDTQSNKSPTRPNLSSCPPACTNFLEYDIWGDHFGEMAFREARSGACQRVPVAEYTHSFLARSGAGQLVPVEENMHSFFSAPAF